MRLKDKVAIITGAGKNIGAAICLTFAKEGADIIVNVRNENGGKDIINKIESMGRKALLVVGDVSKKSDVDQMFAQIKQKFNRIDILVNNASVRPYTPFLEMSEQTWRLVLSVCLNGAFFCSQAAAAFMVNQGSGCIINISGLAGFKSHKNCTHVATAKAGLNGFTKALAVELADFNIRVNSIVPSITDTDRATPIADAIVSQMPLKRLASKQDIANACLFLASDEASYITGHALHVNGGNYMV